MKATDAMPFNFKQLRADCYADLNQTAIPGQIVLAGSSVCEQFPVNEMLQSRRLPHIVYNRGISGDTMTGYAARLNACVLDLKPAKLFINIGSNDMNTPDFDADAHIARYTDMLRAINEALPGCRVHVLSYYPVNPAAGEAIGRGEVYRHRSNALINAVNARLEEMCRDAGCAYINVHDALCDDKGDLRRDFTADGMHMYPRAYAIVLDILLPYFANP